MNKAKRKPGSPKGSKNAKPAVRAKKKTTIKNDDAQSIPLLIATIALGVIALDGDKRSAALARKASAAIEKLK